MVFVENTQLWYRVDIRMFGKWIQPFVYFRGKEPSLYIFRKLLFSRNIMGVSVCGFVLYSKLGRIVKNLEKRKGKRT